MSLCEDFIAAHLLASFLRSQTHSHERTYSLSIEIVTVSPSTPSPFKPFFLTFTKPKSQPQTQTQTQTQMVSQIQVHFDSFGSPTKSPSSLSLAATTDLILQTQSFTQKRFQLSKVQLGRYEVFEVYAKETASSEDTRNIPRFSVLIFDHTARAARSCAVFFVPPGRETDYQFTSEAGLAELATQAQCRRLLAVRCNRPHVFPPMADLQNELSPIAMYLAPADCGPPDEDPIPFMAVQHESDWTELERGALQVAGNFVVEEMPAEDEADSDKFVWRRLVFLENQHFIQTEAKLLFPSSGKRAKGGTANKKKKGGKSKSKAKKEKVDSDSGGTIRDAGANELLLFDHAYLDDHHKAMLVALLCDNTPLISTGSQRRGGSEAETGDVRVLLVGLGGGALAMALQRYLPALRLDVLDLVPGLDVLATMHFGFVAGPRCRTLVQDGVEYILEHGQSPGQGQGQGQGVGQGSSSSSSNESVFTAVEDQGTGKGGRQYHSVVLDVDSKDNALGLSAPPAAFLTPSFLTHLHDCVLLPGGSLCVNVVARDKNKLSALILQLKEIFCASPLGSGGEDLCGTLGRGKVYCLKPSAETVNLTVHAVKGSPGTRVGQQLPLAGLAKQLQALAVSSSVHTKHKKGTGNKQSNTKTMGALTQNTTEMKARERCLDDWLSAANLSNDPLGLNAMLDVIREA